MRNTVLGASRANTVLRASICHPSWGTEHLLHQYLGSSPEGNYTWAEIITQLPCRGNLGFSPNTASKTTCSMSRSDLSLYQYGRILLIFSWWKYQSAPHLPCWLTYSIHLPQIPFGTVKPLKAGCQNRDRLVHGPPQWVLGRVTWWSFNTGQTAIIKAQPNCWNQTISDKAIQVGDFRGFWAVSERQLLCVKLPEWNLISETLTYKIIPEKPQLTFYRETQDCINIKVRSVLKKWSIKWSKNKVKTIIPCNTILSYFVLCYSSPSDFKMR